MFLESSQYKVYKGKTGEIRYIRSGEGQVTLVLIPGTTGDARIFSLLFPILADRFSLVAIDHPSVTTLDEYLDILSEFLISLGGSDLFVLGTSLGGRVVEYVLERNSTNIKGIILGNSYVDNSELVEKNRVNAVLLKIIPTFLIKKILKGGIKKSFAKHPESKLLFQYFNELLDNESRKSILGKLYLNLKTFPLPSPHPELPKLLILSEEDPLIPQNTQNRLMTYYNVNSTVVWVGEKTHFPYLTIPSAYANGILNFIETVVGQNKA